MCHHSGKERPSLHLPGSHMEAESTRHSDLTSALCPQSCPSGEQAAASGDGHGHLASLCTVRCEGSGGKSHVSPAAFRMHLAIVSELGPRPGAKGICQTLERKAKRQPGHRAVYSENLSYARARRRAWGWAQREYQLGLLPV